MAIELTRFNQVLRAIAITRSQTYGTFSSPNPNISRSRIHYVFRFYRLKHLVFYIFHACLSLIRFPNARGAQLSSAKRGFFLCSNTPTHGAVKEILPLEFDVILLPPGANIDFVLSSNKSGAINLGKEKIVYLHKGISIVDVAHSLFDALRLYIRFKSIHQVTALDIIWIWTSCIESKAICKTGIKEIFLTHHLDAAALSAVLSNLEEYISGMHGFPVANYGWTPVWTDTFYVYGESTREYLLNSGECSGEKIKFYRSGGNDANIRGNYSDTTLGIILSGSHEALLELVDAAKVTIAGSNIDKLVIFRHPSRQLLEKERAVIRKLGLEFQVFTLKEYAGDYYFRCLIGNSTAVINAMMSGMIVFLAPTNLPRLEKFFKPDKVVLCDIMDFNKYEYCGKASHLAYLEKQVSYHYN